MVIATELLVKFTNLAPRKSWVNERSDASFCATKPSRLQVLVQPKQSNNCPLSILRLLMDMQEHPIEKCESNGSFFPKFRSNNKNIRNHNLRYETPTGVSSCFFTRSICLNHLVGMMAKIVMPWDDLPVAYWVPVFFGQWMAVPNGGALTCASHFVSLAPLSHLRLSCITCASVFVSLAPT